MERRKIIQTTGFSIASVLIYATVGENLGENLGENAHLIQFPDTVSAVINNEIFNWN